MCWHAAYLSSQKIFQKHLLSVQNTIFSTLKIELISWQIDLLKVDLVATDLMRIHLVKGSHKSLVLFNMHCHTVIPA